MTEVAALLVPAVLASTAAVRREVAADLCGQGLPPDLIDDVLLVATELVSNAVLHGLPLADGAVGVRWDVSSNGVQLCVEGGSAVKRPTARSVESFATSGRGLSIVDAIADSWGVEDRPGRLSVWAHLPMVS